MKSELEKYPEIRVRPTRVEWLKGLYAQGVLRADFEDCRLADKLLFGRFLEEHLQFKSFLYYPKTRGFREILSTLKENSISNLKEVLKKEFPNGWIVKPNGEINSGGETLGFYFSDQELYADLNQYWAFVDKKNELIRSAIEQKDWISPDLGQFTSGERLIFQSDLGAELNAQRSIKSRQWEEVRVHTYEREIIRGGSYHRWKVHPVDGKFKFQWAEEMVFELLQQLPADFMRGRAWSLDVVVFAPDRCRILDVNTNRGRLGHWSGFLDRPRLLGHYTKHFERMGKCHFAGWNGFLFRHGLANYHKYLKRKYIQGIN